MSLPTVKSLDSFATNPLIPVASFMSIDEALAMVDVLLNATIGIVEVTLRTDNSLSIVEAIAKYRPEIYLAAGTVLSVQQLQQVQQAGAHFALSPGISAELLISAKQLNFVFIPGVATASELMLGLSHGFVDFKFFPAAVAGGVSGLKALSAPFPQVRFCPTGGIGLDNFMEYLALPMVRCVGMSQLLPESLRDPSQRGALQNHLQQFNQRRLAPSSRASC
jgi:2-dehydro-3-deoxyphosphogluconate aldolase/(4S)-4-hydroxy-2-oxoglutarate aldolase